MLTADGCQDVATLDGYVCCPPPLCGNDLCCTFVAFFNLLPSGPLWDFWKAAAISYFERNDDPNECPLIKDPRCPSLVLHAIYVVLKLKSIVHNALWPALREADPNTAVTTLDDHLARLQWEDCYAQHCRSVLLDEVTPYELNSNCGPVFCEPDFPPELICAVKRNIAISLSRANMGIIKNLCSINWVVEPLGARIRPVPPVPGAVPPIATDPCNVCMPDIKFQICQTRDWLEGCAGELCESNRPPPHVPAFWDQACNAPMGLPSRIWPGVLAAECIIRSMMPSTCPTNITRCCDA